MKKILKQGLRKLQLAKSTKEKVNKVGYQYDLERNSISYSTLNGLVSAKAKWVPVNDYTKNLKEKYTTVFMTEDGKNIYIKNLPVNVSDDLRNFYTSIIRMIETETSENRQITLQEITNCVSKYEDLESNSDSFNIRFSAKPLAFLDITDIYIMYNMRVDDLFMVIWKNEPNSIYIVNGGVYIDRWCENFISQVSRK